jgi:purine-nucleoside phosphorylase
MEITKEKIAESIKYLKSRGFSKAKFAIILGTGLGKMVDEIEDPIVINYSDIPHFPVSTVEFHSGKLIFGRIEGKEVIVMNGRFHLYEGYSLQQVTYPLRVLNGFGIETLLISNAAGAINPDFRKGDLMLITDHINLQGGSPLGFRNVTDFGERFVDMSEPYDQKLIMLAKQIADDISLNLREGVYAVVFGPHLETRAEYRYLRIIGADAVGMSTVPEVIVANQLQMRSLAISVLTDECDPYNLAPINVPEILAIAGKAEPKLIALFRKILHAV